jgi:hypothetical protein
MTSFRSKPIGWRYESQRHSLAAKGVSSKRYEARREFPASPAIGQYGYGTLVGAYRNARAIQERDRILKAETAGERAGLKAGFQTRQATSQKPLTSHEQRVAQYKLAAALAPAREHAARAIYVPIWRRDLVNSVERLEDLKGKIEAIPHGRKEKEGVRQKNELRKQVREEYKIFKRAKERLESVREPDVAEVLGKMEMYEDVARWASKTSRVGRKHVKERESGGEE